MGPLDGADPAELETLLAAGRWGRWQRPAGYPAPRRRIRVWQRPDEGPGGTSDPNAREIPPMP